MEYYYSGIKLMWPTMKVWEKVIDRRLREETTMREEQLGVVPRKGTMDAIFAARQIMLSSSCRGYKVRIIRFLS